MARQRASAPSPVGSAVQREPLNLQRFDGRDAVHHFDAVAIGVGQSHPLASPRLVNRLHGACTVHPCELVQVCLARGMKGGRDELVLTLLDDVDVVVRTCAAKVERVFRSSSHAQTDGAEKVLGHREVRYPDARVGQFVHLADGHGMSPLL